MELLAMELNNKVVLNSQDENSGEAVSNGLFLSNFLNALPKRGTMIENNDSLHGFPNHDFLYSNIMDPFSNPNKIISSPYTNQNAHNNNGIGNSTDLYGAIGTLIPGSNATNLSPSTSPHTSSSSSSHSIVCGRCEAAAISRCLDCNDALCDDCANLHKRTTFTKDHYIIGMGNITPDLSHLTRPGGITFGTVNEINLNDPQCDIHFEVYRYLCETCKKLVCQECTLRDHKDHVCTPVANVSEKAKDKLQAVLDSGKLGIKYIKTSIDQAVTFSQSVEREALDTSSRIRKAMRHFIIAAEDRERSLLEQVDKYRQQKLTNLSDQMTGLRAALAGLAQTSERLTKAIDSVHNMNCFDIASTLTTAESQIEKFAAMYKNLQPTEEFITFIQPNFDLLQEVRMQGEIVMNLRSQSASVTPNSSTPTLVGHSNVANNNAASNHNLSRRPIVSRSVAPPVQNHAWEPSAQASANVPSMLGNMNGSTFPGQCIPGSQQLVSVKPVPLPNTTFGFDGHEDGQVSRPWGLCTDKDGNIIIADRRNNRVQVYFADGQFKFKFGTKGTGQGQFDLPAGISSDPQNRIVVVDKDNHRVQVFSSTGMFILKFGSFGKECGQFQYPWDVAVNYKGEILVTDSRNHRIQMFNPDGHFISRFSFDGVNHSRYLKGLTTPRGCCFTPDGDIIISDFENHRLILIDAGMTKVMSTKGHEGSALHEFCRPSGICCDDSGRVVVADSKNQRVLIFSPQLEYLFVVEIRPSSQNILTANMDEKDRPSDVSLLPDGRLVVLVETSPDSRDQCSPHKTFVQVY